MRISLPLAALIAALCGSVIASPSPTTQLSIDRVELMPNRPQPFQHKDFKTIARGLDKLLFDFEARGEHLPLIWWDDTKTNSPMRGFGFPSFVGRPSQTKGAEHESITTMGALLGATLAGIDKSKEPLGHNWVEMTQVYFNSANGQNVVLNRSEAETGHTYWYETFPQILFNCLIDRYPDTPRGAEIMHTAAEQWHRGYEALAARPGGLNFDHTGFSLTKLQPRTDRWIEPDGASGIAWIMFSAYRKFGDEKYLRAAKDLCRYTNARAANPHYEINHLWGTYLAARLNAEHDTNYDVGRFINWCFEPSETRPGWGVGVGRWGDYECSGLATGVHNRGGYAFTMNTYVLAGTLVPLVRYDERYARAIGKWMLNAAQASRFFYPDEWPADMQSCPGRKSDPPHVIAYEGLRKRGPGGKSPYATGDAVEFGWGNTDYGIYGSGFVGMMAGIITPSDVEMIPQLDLLACDFFRDKAFLSYLYYNPYEQRREVSVEVGSSPVNIYDAVANDYIARNVTGTVKVPIAADSAVVVVLAPAVGKESFEGRKTLVDGVVIDFDNGQVVRPAAETVNHPDLSTTVAADRADISVDGDPTDWADVKSQALPLNIGGRGTLEVELRFAWNDKFLYVLARQTARGEKVKEATDPAAFVARPYEFDGVWLHLDPTNSTLPSEEPLVCFGLNSSGKPNIIEASLFSSNTRIRSAVSGSADANTRVLEACIPWDELIQATFHGRKKLMQKFPSIAAGFRFGCEPKLIEFDHTRMSFLNGLPHRMPTGEDEHSRDIVLRGSN